MKCGKFLLTTAALGLGLGLLLSSCKKPEERPVAEKTLEIRVVHTPELRSYLSAMKDAFYATNPRLPDGTAINLDLISDAGYSAAKRIATGELKTELWLTPSTSLINYTNTHLKNLGPTQSDCKAVFATPIILAARRDFIQRQKILHNTISWMEMFAPAPAEKPKPGMEPPTVALGVGIPGGATTGLSAFVQLAYFSSSKGKNVLSADDLDDAGIKELTRLEEFVSSYNLSESALLNKLDEFVTTRPRFVLTTEQQLILYNLQHRAQPSRLAALYPSEGSYWEDYALCTSDADWVTTAHRAGINKLVAFLLGDRAQLEAKKIGFRPIMPAADLEMFSEAFGVTTDMPHISLLPVTGPVVEKLMNVWPKVKRPSAMVYVLDTSGSMEGASLSAGRSFINGLLEKSAKDDLRALITFSTEPKLESEFTGNFETLRAALNKTESIGGSAVYDSIRNAFQMLGAEQLNHYRKSVFVFTDGGDKNSSTSLPLLLDFIRDRLNRTDVDLNIVGIDQASSDFGDLEKIAQAAHGTFRKAAAQQMTPLVLEIAGNL